LDRSIPRDLETIIHKCIASDINSRYQTPALIADDLQRFIDGEPVQARRIGLLERTAKWCRRRPAVASLMAALTLSLIGGFAGVSWQWQKTSDALQLANTNLTQAKDQKIIAENQKEIAQQQTTIAQEHFRQARDSVDQFFVKISESKLLKERRLIGLRKEMLTEALGYHQAFVKQYGDDDELKLDLAKSLYSIASIETQLSSDPGLEKRFDEAKIMFRNLHQTDPENEDILIGLVVCSLAQANIQGRFDTQAALKNYTEVIELLEGLRQRSPDSLEGMEKLAFAYQSSGLIEERVGNANRDSGTAMPLYEKAMLTRLELRETLLDLENPYHTLKGKLYEVEIAKLHRDLGVANRMAGNLDAAADHYEEAIAVLKDQLDDEEISVTAIEAMAAITNTIGFFYGTQTKYRNTEKSLKFFELSKSNFQELVNENPFIISYQRGLARAAVNVGSVYQNAGDLEKALQEREFAERVRRKLYETNLGALHLRTEWAMSLNAMGSTLRELGRIKDSLSMHAQAHEHYVFVMEKTRLNHPRIQLVNGLTQTALTHSSNGDYSQALSTLQSIEDFTLDNQIEPIYRMGTEMMVLAVTIEEAIEQITNNQNPQNPLELVSLSVLANRWDGSLKASKDAYTEAARRGCDVFQWSRDDVDFEDFNEFHACQLLAKWLKENFEK
jgi:tetratricopeptide (TPR) repeat protein